MRRESLPPCAPQPRSARAGSRRSRSSRLARRLRELGDALGDGPTAGRREPAERGWQRMRRAARVGCAGRPFQRVGGLPQISPWLTSSRRPSVAGLALSPPGGVPRRTIVATVSMETTSGSLSMKCNQQPRELAELRAFRIGPAALGDFTGRVRDRRRRHLEQLGDRVTDAGGWLRHWSGRSRRSLARFLRGDPAAGGDR